MTEEEIIKKRRSTVIAALRKASRWWGPKQECKKLAKVSPGKYKCNICKEVFTEKECQIDHLSPIIPIKTGLMSWDIFINNLFCNTDNLQNICIFCHQTKSAVEKEQRKIYRALRKKATKNK